MGDGRLAVTRARRHFHGHHRRSWWVYWQLAKAGFRKQAQYKLAMFAGLFTNCVFGFVRAAVMLAAVRAAGDFGGYDEGTIGAYVWLSQGLLGATQFMGPPIDLVSRIKSGDVAVDFLRPVDIQLGYLAADMGRAACTFGPRGIPSIAVGAATFGLSMPSSPLSYVLGVISVLLAVALSFLCLFAVALIGFWVVEIRGIRVLYQIVGTFLAGLFVPVHMFPEWLRTIAHATPFPSILQAPIDTLSGRVEGAAALSTVLIQVVWVVAIAVLGRVLLRAGQRRLEVQGG
ncbi:ABC transporter permease [Nocardia thailandica]|uniref:ABC transporter permease n=1 Tax=Nocardia thailandica TaxID=257275 RepID=UPI0002DBF751|nr:ABC-2 family transporter protein [Nocardia thailandica]